MTAKLIFSVGYLFYLLGLLLPYIVYDEILFDINTRSTAVYASGTNIYSESSLMTYNTILGYLSIIWMIYPLIKILRNSPTAYKQIMLSSIVLLTIYSAIYFMITNNPNSIENYLNVQLSLGFWINVNGTILCFLAGFNSLLSKMKNARDKKKSDELLDDSI